MQHLPSHHLNSKLLKSSANNLDEEEESQPANNNTDSQQNFHVHNPNGINDRLLINLMIQNDGLPLQQ